MSIQTNSEFSVFEGMEPTEYERSFRQLKRIDDTLSVINQALNAEDFNEADRQEVEKNKEFFELRRAELEQALAFGSLLSTQRDF